LQTKLKPQSQQLLSKIDKKVVGIPVAFYQI